MVDGGNAASYSLILSSFQIVGRSIFLTPFMITCLIQKIYGNIIKFKSIDLEELYLIKQTIKEFDSE